MSRVQLITCDYRFVFGTCGRSTTSDAAVGWQLGEYGRGDYCPLHRPTPAPRTPHPVPLIARRRAA